MSAAIRRGLLTFAAPALVVTLITAVVTWPQAMHLSTHVMSHDDPLFSMWRLAWVAHALVTDPSHLFDANIFYPATNTLAYSDAMMLEGLIGAPLFWIGVSPIVIYNLLLVGAIVASGLAMFLLARDLTGDDKAAIVSAVIFTAAPYRIEHFMHLELQWAMWVPLAFWAMHRAMDSRPWQYGVLAGVFLWLQIMSSVYYGVFLAMTMATLALALLATHPREAARALPAIAIGVALALVLAVPYARPYLETAHTLGDRETAEVAAYSATLASYVASPPQSLLWGWTAYRFGSAELKLFPGAITIVLVIASAFHRPRRLTLVYASLALVTILLSLGLNGPVYAWLFDHVSALRGFRSPSRFGIMVACALAVLAGFGARTLRERLVSANSRAEAAFTGGLLMLIAIDNATTGLWLGPPPYQPAGAYNVYKTIRGLGPGPIVELPLPRLDRLPGREATYQFWSITHWQPIVNGYSGHYPREFVQTVDRMEHFPDDRSLAQLRAIGVRYIVVHRAFYRDEDYREVINRVAARPELQAGGRYVDPVGDCLLFILNK